VLGPATALQDRSTQGPLNVNPAGPRSRVRNGAPSFRCRSWPHRRRVVGTAVSVPANSTGTTAGTSRRRYRGCPGPSSVDRDTERDSQRDGSFAGRRPFGSTRGARVS
jgi:hypothetical protein